MLQVSKLMRERLLKRSLLEIWRLGKDVISSCKRELSSLVNSKSNVRGLAEAIAPIAAIRKKIRKSIFSTIDRTGNVGY